MAVAEAEAAPAGAAEIRTAPVAAAADNGKVAVPGGEAVSGRDAVNKGGSEHRHGQYRKPGQLPLFRERALF